MRSTAACATLQTPAAASRENSLLVPAKFPAGARKIPCSAR